MKFLGALVALVLVAVAPPGLAQEAKELTPEQKAFVEKMQKLEAELKPQFGDVRLEAAKTTFHLEKAYYFLPAEDARRVLTEAWGNPPSNAEGIDGMIFPAGASPVFADWGVVVDFESSGFVTDKDADKADYGKMITDVQKAEPQINKERQGAGFPAMHLVGWAQPPSYDKTRHTLIWAREIAYAGEEADHTLNYDARILGRHGVLSLNMVSTMSLLPQVREASQALATKTDYDAGARYVDYDPKTDKTAEYGVAGLVAAGLGLAAAKKLGFLALFLAFAKKGFVFLAAAGAALFGWVKRTFGAKPKPAPSTPAEPDPAPPGE